MRTLIAYFSWSNNTKRLVEEINQRFNFDVVRIERKVPYSKDYDQCAYVEAKEEVESRVHPAIRNMNLDFNQYDMILLFCPIWWYTVPMPVLTFTEKLGNYQGKILLFANSYTNDPKYMENSIRDLKHSNPNVRIEEGLFNSLVNEHIRFIIQEEIK